MPEMNVLPMLPQARNGAAIGNPGHQFRRDNNQAGAAIKALLPALFSGLKRNASSPQGLEGILQAVQSDDYACHLDDPMAAAVRQSGAVATCSMPMAAALPWTIFSTCSNSKGEGTAKGLEPDFAPALSLGR